MIGDGSEVEPSPVEVDGDAEGARHLALRRVVAEPDVDRGAAGEGVGHRRVGSGAEVVGVERVGRVVVQVAEVRVLERRVVRAACARRGRHGEREEREKQAHAVLLQPKQAQRRWQSQYDPVTPTR